MTGRFPSYFADMSPRMIIIVLLAVGVPVGLVWLISLKFPSGPSSSMPDNPVNPIVAKAWKGPGFLEFLPDTTTRHLLSYCMEVSVTDSTAGIASARLPFLAERASAKLHEIAADTSLFFGHCGSDSMVVPWKSFRAHLSGEPGQWMLRFQVLSNVGPDEMPDIYQARVRILEELDSAVDAAARAIGRELPPLAAKKRTIKSIAPTESFTDPRDNTLYPVVTVGGTRWMASNLAYKTPNAWCPEMNDSICRRKGLLYPFAEAVGACPPGWRVPSDERWRELSKLLPRLDLAMIPTREGLPYSDRGDDGFAPTPRGIRDARSRKMRLETQAWWWSSSECRDDAYCAPFGSKYIVHLLDDMSLTWGLRWNPKDSAAPNGWSRMLAWKELNLPVRCVEDRP